MYRHWHLNRGRSVIALLFLALLAAGLFSKAQAGAAGNLHVAAMLPPALPPLPKSELLKSQSVSAKNISLYNRIFIAQNEGNIAEANRLMKRLSDPRLRGHVLYQRYLHPTAYRPDFGELQDWMHRYAGQPGAERIYRLAMARMPKGYKGTLAAPEPVRGVTGYAGLSEPGGTCRIALPQNPKDAKIAATLLRDVKASLRKGDPAAALHTLEKSGHILSFVDFDRVRGQIAYGFMNKGQLDRARRIALAAAKRSGADAPDAGWIAGLAAWRRNDDVLAQKMFTQVASSPCASGWMTSGGAYWASRASLRRGDVAAVRPLLERAAQWPRTFYGMIATRSLGWDFDFDWTLPDYTARQASLLSSIPAFQRADALVKAGQPHMAEAELLTINPDNDRNLRSALMAYAAHIDLAGFALRLAEAYPRPEGGFYDAALYPLLPWKPSEGFRVDEALLHALIRQESRFDPEAQSERGASGLMQLMPGTATDVSGMTYTADHTGRHALKNPETNLDIGQRYVENLMGAEPVGAELVSLLIAYNAGPGALSRWKKQYADTLSDPLLFMETIPAPETRDYVERVMANYWIYRLRLDQKPSSLDEVAQGQWMNYTTVEAADKPRLVLNMK